MCLQYKSFENTVGKGEIATSNFSFSHKVFYFFEELSSTFTKLEIVVCKLFQFKIDENLLFGKVKDRNSFWYGMKTLHEKEKMLVFKMFSFSHNVSISKRLLFQVYSKSGLCGKKISSGCQHLATSV